MIRTHTVPPALEKAPEGAVYFAPARGGLQIYVRIDPHSLGRLPHPCTVDVALPAWNTEAAYVVALVFRLARREQLTYQCWINAAAVRGQQCLGSLAVGSQIVIHLVTTEVARSITIDNSLRPRASGIQKKLSENRRTWTPEALTAAQTQVDTMYPTPAALWRACERFLDA